VALFRLPPALVARTDRITLNDPVFISDLHLNAAQPATRAAFARFCAEVVPQHKELVILGDLFEFWAGDDDPDAVGAEVAGTLAAVADAGVHVYLMHGNRDLLLGSGFCTRAKATLLADPTLALISGQGVLLAHGDAYCTRDTEYMAFRRKARKALFQTLFLAKSLADRRELIGQARATSEARKHSEVIKSMEIMDVTPAEIEQAMAHYSVRTMVHGHTHRPATHHHVVDGQGATRWVLPDWDLDSLHERGGYLTVREGKWKVQGLRIAD
jgi:UDP-2,3-diacylglucosamine hydrolase